MEIRNLLVEPDPIPREGFEWMGQFAPPETDRPSGLFRNGWIGSDDGNSFLWAKNIDCCAHVDSPKISGYDETGDPISFVEAHRALRDWIISEVEERMISPVSFIVASDLS